MGKTIMTTYSLSSQGVASTKVHLFMKGYCQLWFAWAWSEGRSDGTKAYNLQPQAALILNLVEANFYARIGTL